MSLLIKLSRIAFLLVGSIQLTYCQSTPQSNNINLIDRFKEYYEQDKFGLILNDFDSIQLAGDFDRLNHEELTTLRYIKFASEVHLNLIQNFDSINFTKLLEQIKNLKSPSMQFNYAVSVSNIISDVHSRFPEWSIAVTNEIIGVLKPNESKNLESLDNQLLTIQLNSYSRLNRFKEANEIMAKFNKTTVEKSTMLRSYLSNAHYFIQISQFQKAHAFLIQADSLLANYDFTEPDSIQFYIAWGKFFSQVKDYENANLYFQIANAIATDNNYSKYQCLIEFELSILIENPELKVEIQKKLLENTECSDEPLLPLSILNSIGVTYSDMGEYDKALYYYRLVEELEDSLFEEINIFTLLNLSDAYINLGQFNSGLQYLQKALSRELESVKNNFLFLSNEERYSYWYSKIWLFNRLANLAIQGEGNCDNCNDALYNNILIAKSLILSSSLEIDRTIKQSKSPILSENFNEMKKLRLTYSKLLAEGYSNIDILSKYKSKADSIDKIIMAEIGDYASFKNLFEINWQNVQSNLLDADASIEFFRYYDNIDSTFKYAAIILRKDFAKPKLIKLDQESKIKSAISDYDFISLYDLVWSPIESCLQGIKNIYYSTEGILNNVAFSALCQSESDSLNIAAQYFKLGSKFENLKVTSRTCKELLIDKYSLHSLMSTRSLADNDRNLDRSIERSIGLYGAIDYDATAETSGFKRSYEYSALISRQQLDTLLYLNYAKVNFLPGTKEEVKNISSLLNEYGWQVNTVTGSKASEFDFKMVNNETSPGIIHIATHGFTFGDQLSEISYSSNDRSSYANIDPMTQCGLMLSGSNINLTDSRSEMIDKTGDDGILTAGEVSNLDLSNTLLVVLSACETGLGKIEAFEGTYGLARGFKLAGVDQIIVSLWSVPDKETMELMTLFYEDLRNSLHPIMSFEKAMKEMRLKYPNEPRKWAGFKLIQ